ncbi:bifunctional diaminohydroxyphosphoribosylaminopyrimidine deaminase/5-amino-6-(5-phosphoribosylamino)uracil reductase RibD [Patescibacteria group bacterium]|nr:bifunctional diaminohydroxyphosphoribosylaminopyrimidine deaminase/5-amino-6-(5-phosphoribosylamino)uracil reductase RibD [Patescibacteria group bacterium]
MDKSLKDEQYITKAIALARKGEGAVSPNPLVGAIIVKNGSIIGRGYHKRFGTEHAEINAFKDADKKGNKNKLVGSTLYVTLEPCCHWGNTPPCVDEIIKRKIKRVVIAHKDQNPLINGKGTNKLRIHGIKVDLGVLEEEAKKLNYPFLKYMRTQMPFVILKMGISLDGKITHPKKRYITNKKSLDYVHHIRNSVDAILVGHNTYKKDKPRLTTRLKGGKNPRPVVLPKSKTDLTKLLKHLGKEQVTSILVEGGQETATSFLNHNLVDKVYLFLAPEFFGGGELAMFGKLDKIVKLKNIHVEKLDENIMISGYVKQNR